MQEPQLLASLNPTGHVWHSDPDHWVTHVQLHPELVVPVTPLALLLQLASMVHLRAQFG